ncbi:hypothetical protein Droror1_Dr00006908 [Drosera rotundifolia]
MGGVEHIVRSVVAQQINETFDTVPKTIHFYFQDCFLDACDASILCTTPISNPAVATVVKAKEAVDSVAGCQNKVSCADIFTMAVRDVIYLVSSSFIAYILLIVSSNMISTYNHDRRTQGRRRCTGFNYLDIKFRLMHNFLLLSFSNLFRIMPVL